MRTVTTILFLIIFLTSVPCYSQELTRELVIQAANQARRDLQSGEVTAITTLERSARKTEAEIAEAIRIEKELRLKRFVFDPSFPESDAKTYEAEFLTPTLNYDFNRDREHTEVDHSTTLFQNVFPADVTHPTHYQYKVTTVDAPEQTIDSEAASHLDAQRFWLLVYDGNTQVKQDIGHSTLLSPLRPQDQNRISNSDRHGGYWDFSLFGRPLTPIPADAALVGKEDIQGSPCYILESGAQNGGSKRIWVDSDRDFCVRKIEILTPTGAVDRFTVFKNFEKFGEVWVPKIRESTFYKKDGTLRAKLRTEIIAAEFNIDFPKDFFKIDRDFYRPEIPRHPDMGSLPDSDITPADTKNVTRLLLCGPQSLSRICELRKVKTSLSELKKLSGFDPNTIHLNVNGGRSIQHTTNSLSEVLK